MSFAGRSLADQPAARRRRVEAGFTLIEMMTVVSIIAILGASALLSFRQDEFENQRDRFLTQAHAMILQAKRSSIDEQRPYRLRVTGTDLWLERSDVVGLVTQWGQVMRYTMASHEQSLVQTGSAGQLKTCVAGFMPMMGAASLNPVAIGGFTPNAVTCLSAADESTLVFQPNGSIAQPPGGTPVPPGVGYSLVVVDQRLGTADKDVRYGMVEVLPTGMVRYIGEVKP